MASINDLARSLRQYFLPTKSTFTIGGSIFVDAASSYDLGSVSSPFRNIYAASVLTSGVSSGNDFIIDHPTNDPLINKNGTWYAVNFGITGDSAGTVDESNHISLMFDVVGQAGGGTIIMRALTPTDKIYIAKIITCAYSNIHIKFLSPVIYGASGSMRLMGQFSEFTRSGKNAGKLASNAAVGGFTLVLSTSASCMQASDFLVGDRIVIRGQNDINGKAIERQICFITAINTGTNTLTVSEELDYTFKTVYVGSDWAADATTGTTIYVTTYSVFTGDIAKNAYTAVVVNASLFLIGDLVMVSDSRNEHDMNAAAISGSGPYVNPANLEFAKISDINYTTNTITFDHALRRSYLYSAPYYGGITKVVPVEHSSIEGAVITYNADQTSKSINSLQITYAQDCHIFNCTVNGQTLTSAAGVMPVTFIGRMGQALRVAYAYKCSAYKNNIWNAGHTGSGEGYGITIYYATSIEVYNNIVAGCRHNYLCQLATLGDIYGNVSIDDRISGIDLHGVQDVDCHIHGNRCIRSNLHTSDSTKGGGIRNGNTSHAGGSHGTVIENNIITGYTDTNAFAIDIIAASQDVIIQNNTIIDCYNGIGNSLNSSQVTPVQTISNTIIKGNIVIRATNRAYVIQGKPYYDNTNSNGMMDKLYFVDNVSDGNKHHFDLIGEDPSIHSTSTSGITNVLIQNNKVINPDTSTANIYAILLTDVGTVRVYDNNLSGANKGISATRCTTLLAVSKNVLTNLVNSTVYNDGGGNATGTFNLNITDTGVGIGITAPGAPLDVFKTGTNDPIAQFGSTGASDSQAIRVTNGTANAALAVSGGTNAFTPGSAVGDAILRSGSGKKIILSVGGATSALTVDGTGQVGIATTVPAYNLSVASGVSRATTATTTVAAFGSSDTSGSNDLLYYVRVGGHATQANRFLSIGGYENSFGAQALLLQELGGKVGIGSSLPAEALHVIGNVRMSGNLIVDGNLGAWTALPYDAKWSDYSATFVGRYRKIGDMVIIEGACKRNTGSSADTTIATMPAFYRPANGHQFATSGNTVLVSTLGIISVSGVGNGAFVGLSTIIYSII